MYGVKLTANGKSYHYGGRFAVRKAATETPKHRHESVSAEVCTPWMLSTLCPEKSGSLQLLSITTSNLNRL